MFFPQCSLLQHKNSLRLQENPHVVVFPLFFFMCSLPSIDSSISAPSFRRYFAAASRCPSHLDPDRGTTSDEDRTVEPQHCFFEYASLLHQHHPVFKNPRLPNALSALSALIQFSTKSSLGTSGARIRLGRQHCRAAVASGRYNALDVWDKLRLTQVVGSPCGQDM